MTLRVVVALGLCLLLAGCGMPGSESSQPSGDAPPAPESDVIGWENGYWHNSSLSVDQSDGLDEAELEAFVSRAQARVESIRDREFERTVPVNVTTRAEYRDRRSNRTQTDGPHARWNNQVWEALFIIGEETNSERELSSTTSTSIAGFYSPSSEEITIVTSNEGPPTVDPNTLIHELTHALQDQLVGLDSEQFGGQTQDGQLASRGLTEGEANYVEAMYEQRCGDSWRCVSTPESDGSDGGRSNRNFGVFLTQFQPYSDGPVYIDDLLDDGGWDAVEAAYDSPPVSTEQVIHRTDEQPAGLEFDDRARGDWTRFPDQGLDGADTVGEASIYAMFWYQSRQTNTTLIDWRSFQRTSTQFDEYDYESPPSVGWADDTLVPYERNGEFGYVWVTSWDTENDAGQFHSAYVEMLEEQDTRRVNDTTYVVESGPYADAFRVVRSGDRVTIVNAPTTEGLSEIRPGIDGTGPPAASSPGLPGGGLLTALTGFALLTVILVGGSRRRNRRRSE